MSISLHLLNSRLTNFFQLCEIANENFLQIAFKTDEFKIFSKQFFL